LNNFKRIIWLQSIFSENCEEKSSAISPAANLWQYEFIKSLKKLKIGCFCVGHKYESIFPRGKFFVKTLENDLVTDIKNKSFNYINFPYFKDLTLKIKYYHYLKNFDFKSGDIILTYNDSFISDIAAKLNNNFNIPWISIVADLKAPEKANGYVYLNWKYFKISNDKNIKIHIDGGINSSSASFKLSNKYKKKIILYAGTIGGHAGALYLIQAFNLVKDNDVELWLCGKGNDHDIKKLVDKDKRIKLLGYVSKKKLEKLCAHADIFVNPRKSDGNDTNFPSKILFYLTFKKPVISTKSGLSPKYDNVLFLLSDEKIKTLTNKINQVLSLQPDRKKVLNERITSFIKHNSWNNKAKNFVIWINKEIKFK